MKLYGRVTDFEGRPLGQAGIRVLGRGFERDIAMAVADEQGRYALEIERGTYLAVWICKDYKEKALEYWAWHVPVEDDLELNARVGGLEVYGLNAFWPKHGPVLMVYFRPMSLKRVQVWEAGPQEDGTLVDIAPDLEPDDIEVTIDGEAVPLLGVNKVREETPPHYMDAYLIQVRAEGVLETDAYRKIGVAIVDRETREKGEGSVFRRPARYEE